MVDKTIELEMYSGRKGTVVGQMYTTKNEDSSGLLITITGFCFNQSPTGFVNRIFI